MSSKKRASKQAARLRRQLAKLRAPKPVSRTARMLRLAALLAPVATIVGVLVTIAVNFGPLWPTAPEFVGGAATFTSPFDTAFTVKNRSAIFPIRDLAISCKLLHYRGEGPTGSGIEGGPSTIMARQTNNSLDTLSSGSFKCPVRGLMVIDRADGADRVTAAQIAFSSEYSVPVFGRQSAISQTFTLDLTTLPPQWLTGTKLR